MSDVVPRAPQGAASPRIMKLLDNNFARSGSVLHGVGDP